MTTLTPDTSGGRRMRAGLENSVRLRCLRVFVDQSAEDWAALDLAGGWGDGLCYWEWWPLGQGSVWPVLLP